MAFEQLIQNTFGWIIGGGITVAGILAILIWKHDKTKRVSDLRLFVHVMSLVGLYFLFAYVTWLLVVLLVLFAVTLLVGRFFCGWICPFGLYMDVVTLAREKMKKRYHRLPEKLNRALHWARWPILLVFVALPFIIGPFSSLDFTFALYLKSAFKPITVLIAPMEPLVVPWANGPIGFPTWSISYPYLSAIKFYSPADFAVPLMIFFVAITLVSSFFVRRFWCRFCPTGISLAAVNYFRGFRGTPVLHIDKTEEKCTKCGICKRVCPVQVTEVYEKAGGKILTSMCMDCFRCVEMCPYEGCLKVKLGNKTAFNSRNWLEPSRSE